MYFLTNQNAFFVDKTRFYVVMVGYITDNLFPNVILHSWIVVKRLQVYFNKKSWKIPRG